MNENTIELFTAIFTIISIFMGIQTLYQIVIYEFTKYDTIRTIDNVNSSRRQKLIKLRRLRQAKEIRNKACHTYLALGIIFALFKFIYL